MIPEKSVDSAAGTAVTFRSALQFWIKLGWISFGGPTGQIAIMHQEVVENKKWITESQFLHALNYCMFLPGPEAQQLAIYSGWLLHGTWGGIAAGALFVIPSIFILLILSYIYAAFGNVPWISSIFYGLKGAVMAIVAAALLRIAKKALKNRFMWGIALLAFVAIFWFRVPFPAIIAAAGIIGFTGGKILPSVFVPSQDPEDQKIQTGQVQPSLLRALKVILICVSLWSLPILISAYVYGRNHTIVQEGIFFSKAAMVTFGGAYAVLPYVSQQAVEHYAWLRPAQMMDGLGLAETTPGPLIMVVQFVGFMGGWNHPGNLSPLTAAILGGLLSTWVTFVPCFLWIFLGAPHIELLRGNRNFSSTLSCITAAVVGVVLNLAVWFSETSIFHGDGNIDWFLTILSLIAFGGMLRFNWGIVSVVSASGLIGLLYKSFF